MSRATLLRRLELLEKQLPVPPSLDSLILRTATDDQLDRIEYEIETGGPYPVWDALVASYKSGVPGS